MDIRHTLVPNLVNIGKVTDDFSQNDTMPTRQPACHKKDKTLQVDNLNTEPQTFCSLIEIKEIVTK